MHSLQLRHNHHFHFVCHPHRCSHKKKCHTVFLVSGFCQLIRRKVSVSIVQAAVGMHFLFFHYGSSAAASSSSSLMEPLLKLVARSSQIAFFRVLTKLESSGSGVNSVRSLLTNGSTSPMVGYSKLTSSMLLNRRVPSAAPTHWNPRTCHQ